MEGKCLDENTVSNIQNQAFKTKSCQASILSLQKKVTGHEDGGGAVNIYRESLVRLWRCCTTQFTIQLWKHGLDKETENQVGTCIIKSMIIKDWLLKQKDVANISV